MALGKPKRLRKTPAHNRAPKQEAETAKRLGGRVVRGSGCGSEKGDARVEGVIRVENKTTRAKSFSVTREMIAKIESAALSAGEVPAMEIEFLNEQGKPVSSISLIPNWALEILVDRCSQDDK